MRALNLVALLSAAILLIACGKKSAETMEKKQTDRAAETSTTRDKNSVAEDNARSEAVAVITSVHAQWIILDSMPKAEITLMGENLVANPVVTSKSPQVRVAKIEPDPARTLVIVEMAIASPAGIYEFQYEAPGNEPIPFSIQYAGMK